MRLFAPEVIQTSAMDCGPASLKCLLEGFGIPVSYGRLREACQTDVDGTSIDTIEDLANELGLDASQEMIPPDHLIARGGEVLPGLAVVRLASGVTHFVVLWRRHGPLVQVMDPGSGRRWMTTAALLDDLYVHKMPIAAEAWREWAAGDEFIGALVRLAARIGISASDTRSLVAQASADPSWRGLAALDAGLRMTGALVRSGGVAAGGEAKRLLVGLVAKSEDIPDAYWSARPAPPDDDGADQVEMRGAIVVRVAGVSAVARPQRSLELQAALAETSVRPGRDLLALLRRDGWLSPFALIATLATLAGGVVLEALLLLGLVEAGRDLTRSGERLGAIGALLVFALVLLAIELGAITGIARIGRRLEARLRVAFLDKIPRLPDRYFRSRLTSDMAERSHSIHHLRQVSELAGRTVRAVLELAVTTAGLVWLYPSGAAIAIGGALAIATIPLVFRTPVIERDLRQRSHSAALARFYLDALLGAVPIRTHGASGAVRREHESLLVEWCRAAYRVVGAVVTMELVLAVVGIALTVALVAGYVEGTRYGGGTALLLAYWALAVPQLGQDIAMALREAMVARNRAVRIAEPLGAPEEAALGGGELPAGEPTGGVAIELDQVEVRAGGHVILREVSLAIEPGQHVAIVGVSGAGKSTLVGLLLGFHRPTSGQLRVDGAALSGAALERLRARTVWVDPEVQLWNRSLLDNIYYGAAPHAARPLDRVLETAQLRGMLERLGDGLQTSLGESGAQVSGGEGQRVRFGRGLVRADQRLVVLDEPFRGLDREARRMLLARARAWWRDATVLCVTHDIGETRGFDRVVVVEDGVIREHGSPRELAASESRYAALLAAEDAVRAGTWASADWRRLEITRGLLRERKGGP